MRKRTFMSAVAVGGLTLGAFATGAMAIDDWGQNVQHDLEAHARDQYGVDRAIDSPSANTIDAATAEADPTKLVTLAKGLEAHVATSAPNAGPNIDMMTFWPNDEHPTHIIACNEQDPQAPGLQRIDLATGAVETIVTGTTSCDPAHRTPWGTILFGEEAGDGHLLEIIDPLNTTGVVYDRTAGSFSDSVGTDDSANIAVRDAVGQLAFEGIGIYGNGVLYYGDENRPSSGKPGGAYFKFVPATPWSGDAPITQLSQSPLTAGQIYGLRLGLRDNTTTAKAARSDRVPGCRSRPGTCAARPRRRA
jgi:hypothetical protein